MNVHPFGECFDTLYGRNCDGFARYVINPYDEEIHGEQNWQWICEGVYEGMCQDI